MKRSYAPAPAIILCTIALLALVHSGPTLAQGEEEPPPFEKRYWAFLTTGKSAQGVERAELEAMQAKHLENFGRLHKDGKLFAAGPMVDPDKKKRGIVVLGAPDMKSLPSLFEPDPFVTNGYLTIDAIEMGTAVGEFHADIDPTALAEYRLVLLEDAKDDASEIEAEMLEKNLEYCKSIHDDERLCFAAWLKEDAAHRRAVLVFRKLEDAALEKLVSDVPTVKSGDWKSTTYPLYMSDGVMK